MAQLEDFLYINVRIPIEVAEKVAACIEVGAEGPHTDMPQRTYDKVMGVSHDIQVAYVQHKANLEFALKRLSENEENDTIST